MKGTWRLTVEAPSDKDAIDIVSRRARDDGWVVLGAIKVSKQLDGRYHVVLSVARA